METPDTLYAKTGDVHVAYQVFGDGSIDLVLVPGWISQLDIWWDSPATTSWLRRMGQFARVVMDVRNSACGVLGWSEGGSLAALLAASHPDRCQALVLYHGVHPLCWTDQVSIIGLFAGGLCTLPLAFQDMPPPGKVLYLVRSRIWWRVQN